MKLEPVYVFKSYDKENKIIEVELREMASAKDVAIAKRGLLGLRLDAFIHGDKILYGYEWVATGYIEMMCIMERKPFYSAGKLNSAQYAHKILEHEAIIYGGELFYKNSMSNESTVGGRTMK